MVRGELKGFKDVFSRFNQRSAMNRIVYKSESSNNRAIGREILEDLFYEAQSKRLESYGVPPQRVNYILSNPSLLALVDKAICMIKIDPELSLRGAILEIAHRGGLKEETPHGYLTMGNYDPSKLIVRDGSIEIEEIPFSDLEEEDSRKVNCQVFGIYRERVSSSKHFYEHAISYEKE